MTLGSHSVFWDVVEPHFLDFNPWSLGTANRNSRDSNMCLWSIQKLLDAKCPTRYGHPQNTGMVLYQFLSRTASASPDPLFSLTVLDDHFKPRSLGGGKKSGLEHYSCPATESSYWKSASSFVEEMEPPQKRAGSTV